MKRILLVCAAGMSTSLLVDRIKELIAIQNLPYEIRCCDVDSGMAEVYACDVVLLAPQISYSRTQMETITTQLRIPLGMIDRSIYQYQCADQIFACACDLLETYQSQFIFHICLLYAFEKGCMFDLLMKDMQNYCQKQGIQVSFDMDSVSTFVPQKCKADIVLLEPQLSYLRQEIEPYLNPMTTTFVVIDRKLMGGFQGAKILAEALWQYEQQKLHRIEFRKEEGV